MKTIDTTKLIRIESNDSCKGCVFRSEDDCDTFSLKLGDCVEYHKLGFVDKNFIFILKEEYESE